MLSLFNILHGQTENNLKQCAKEHINPNTNNQTSNFAEYINKKYIRFQPKIEDMKFTKTRKPTLMDYNDQSSFKIRLIFESYMHYINSRLQNA